MLAGGVLEERGGDRVDPVDGGVARRAPRLDRQVLVDEVRVQVARLERGMVEGRDQKVAVGRYRADTEGRECAAKARDRLVPGRRVGDHLREEGIVVHPDLAAGFDAAVVADARNVGGLPERDAAGRRQEVVRGILGVEPRLESVSGERDLGLRQREPFALRDEDLPAHEVEPRDRLGHRVLHLEASVHLEEVEGARLVDDELDRAGADVADRFGGRDGGAAHAGAERGIDRRGRRLLDDLLVAALDRALALAQVDHVAVGVAEDLDLDVTGRVEVPLDQQRAVAEGALGLAARGRERLGEGRLVANDAHALAATASRRLDQDRETDLARGVDAFLERQLRERRSGDDGDVGARHDLLRADLAAHAADRVDGRSDEDEARGRDALRELGVLG
jgi:hypothetical protein